LDMINMTFGEYLRKNSLEALIPCSMFVVTAQGYGLDDVPALYGLWWLSPAFLKDIMREKAGGPRYLSVVKDGWQNLWKEITARDKLDIEFGVSIQKINRHLDNLNEKIDITTYDEQKNEVKYECDFLILACPLKSSLEFLSDSTDLEKTILGSIVSFSVVTTLIEGPHREFENNHFGITFYYHRLNHADLGRIYAETNSQKLFLCPKPSKRHAILYQIDNHYDEQKMGHYREQLWEDLKQYQEDHTNVKVLDENHWDYFPHFTQEDINNNYPWKLFEAQGQSKTWYIGSSACFESVEDVVSYNLLLEKTYLG